MPIITIARCVQSLVAWVYLVTIVFDDEPFEYIYEIGSTILSEHQAEALAKRHQFLERARSSSSCAKCISGSEFNDVELHTA